MKNKKIFLCMILFMALVFSFNLTIKMNKEKESHEVKAQIIERYDRIVNTADELQAAIDARESVIHLNSSFSTNRTYYVNYAVEINPYSASNGIGYTGGGSLFVVQNGGRLTVAAIVVGNQGNGNWGSRVITVQNGGRLIFERTSIVDCSGSNNGYGIVLESGATANMNSSWTLNAAYGMYVKAGATLTYGYVSGRDNTISGCTNGIYFENLNNTINFNSSSIAIGPVNGVGGNTNGVVVAAGNGTLNISAGNYYQNTNAIVAKSGTVNISGGTIYSNSSWGVLLQGGTVNFWGGTIRNNTTGVGIDNNANNKFVMTGGSIYGNNNYSIYQNNGNDGSCRITGGSVSGAIYLAQNDNYVNTYSNYPTLTITPSTYWLGRKLVKTDSNAVANTEFGKVTMTPSGDWYKYVKANDDYIVVWRGRNVVVNHINKYTSEILAQDLLNGNVGDSWESNSKTIEGYKYFSSPETTSGTYGSSDLTINYQYVKVSNVVTKYIDENYGTTILTETNSWGQGETYTTDKKTLDTYTFTRDSGNTTAEMGDSDVEVTYYYKKTSEGVDIRFINQVTGFEIAPTQHIPGLEKDAYTATALEIDGYILVSTEDTITGEMPISKTTITFEYRKLSDVTARYVDANYDTNIIPDIVNTYKEGDPYTTEEKEFEGYVLIDKFIQKDGIVGDHDILVQYNYKKISEGIEVHYIDQVTEEEIAEGIAYAGIEKLPYYTVAKEIPGYELVKAPENAVGEMAVEKITLVYEYRKNSYITTRYVNEINGYVLSTQSDKKYKEGDTYTTEQLDLDGYTCSRIDGNPTGVVGRDNIMVTYYYKKNTSVTAKYVDMLNNNQEITEKVVIQGLQNDDYETSKKAIDGYTFIEVEGIANGKMPYDSREVIYKYKKTSNLVTRHIDANTNQKIVDDVIKSVKEGEKFESYPQNIPGYVIVQQPDSNTGIMGREDIVKTFYYKKLSHGLAVKYVDRLVGDVLSHNEYSGNENDTIPLIEKTFLGYVLDERPSFESIKLGVEAQEVTYYYKKAIEVKVLGIDQETGDEIYSTIVSGVEGDTYITTPRTVPGYELVRIPEDNEGIFSREDITVVYEYRKIAKDVIVKYMNAETGEEMGSYRISGNEGDSYQAERKEFENYKIVRVEGSEVGVLSREEQEVTYYYERKTGTVQVVYEDEDDNEVLKEEFTGKIGDTYEITIKDIDGYEVSEVIGNTTGKYEAKLKEVKVKLKNTKVAPIGQGTIVVRFLDELGRVLREDYIEEGEEGKPFYYELPEIEGYRILGNKVIKTKFVDGEQIFDAMYERIPVEDVEIVEEAPATGDIQVYALTLVTLISMIGIIFSISSRKVNE